MLTYIQSKYTKYFHEPQSILLSILLLLAVPLIWWFGYLFIPFFVAIITAYLLEAPIALLIGLRVPRVMAVILVYCLFMVASILTLVGFLPVLFDQIRALLKELPVMMDKAINWLEKIPENYPDIVSPGLFQSVTGDMGRDLISSMQGEAVNFSIASVSALVTISIYIIVVPFLVLFLLLDKQIILSWFVSCLPAERRWLRQIWHSMDQQLSHYVRGKFYEMLVIFLVSMALFGTMELNYAPLLAVLVGLSVIIPYVGAIVVTFPVVLIALFQWGVGPDFYWTIGLYTLFQLLDGYLLVPLLFSRVINMHPLAVIFAILFFGGLWGLWGVFLSIPLATFIRVLVQSWPKPLAADVGGKIE